MKCVGLDEYGSKMDVDSVVNFESFRALKLSNSEIIRAIKF